jgi:uncharacterized protein YciI
MRRLFLAVAILLFAAPAFSADAPAPPAPLYVLLYHWGPAWKADLPLAQQPNIQPHGAYMKKLFADGVTLAAGPFADNTGGLLIIHAKSLDDAKAIAAADPGVSSGLFQPEIHAWNPVIHSDQPPSPGK